MNNTGFSGAGFKENGNFRWKFTLGVHNNNNNNNNTKLTMSRNYNTY